MRKQEGKWEARFRSPEGSTTPMSVAKVTNAESSIIVLEAAIYTAHQTYSLSSASETQPKWRYRVAHHQILNPILISGGSLLMPSPAELIIAARVKRWYDVKQHWRHRLTRQLVLQDTSS